jgi:DNA-binding MarR family transcriptional regulator
MGYPNKREALSALIDELFQVNGRVLAEGDKLSAEHGLTAARWQVLAALYLEQRPLTVAQIARRMGLQRQSVQRLADILVEQGILSYRPNPEHKRAKLVDFTARGQETVAEMERLHHRWADGIVPDFSQEELEQAVGVLQKLREKLE